MSVFHSPYEQYKSRNGQEFQVIKEITVADETHDEEVLPMYVIQFDDGEQIEAYPEEIGVG